MQRAKLSDFATAPMLQRGELETMSMKQTFVSKSMIPTWIAICAKRKLGLQKSCFILLVYVTISLEGKV